MFQKLNFLTFTWVDVSGVAFYITQLSVLQYINSVTKL